MYSPDCPYCGKEVEICQDDGHGCEEDVAYEEQCLHCEMYFVFYTTVTFSHDAQKAPCLNGEEHKLKQVEGWPEAFLVGVKRCEYCGEEFHTDPEGRKKALEECDKSSEEEDTNA